MPSDRETSEFLLRACHDLRSPLRGLRAYSELVQKYVRDGASADDIQRALDFILDGARKADAVIDGIAAYAAALQIDPGTFFPTRLDVALRSALARLDPSLKESGAQVAYAEMPRLRVNPDRLAELFERLIRNTLDHRGPEPPRVQISADRFESGWRVVVRDNGPGIEPAELETVFRPFQKLQGKGAGMGLAICRAIVQAHGGTIHAESPQEGGCAIIFTLPEQD
jgi:light-regulated signal transduction histidine kinase (bacteriophytochrome)